MSDTKKAIAEIRAVADADKAAQEMPGRKVGEMIDLLREVAARGDSVIDHVHPITAEKVAEIATNADRMARQLQAILRDGLRP